MQGGAEDASAQMLFQVLSPFFACQSVSYANGNLSWCYQHFIMICQVLGKQCLVAGRFSRVCLDLQDRLKRQAWTRKTPQLTLSASDWFGFFLPSLFADTLMCYWRMVTHHCWWHIFRLDKNNELDTRSLRFLLDNSFSVRNSVGVGINKNGWMVGVILFWWNWVYFSRIETCYTGLVL